jgi:hypothetical protein
MRRKRGSMSDNNMFDELFTIQKLTREQAEAVRKEPTSVFSSLDPKIAKQVAEISKQMASNAERFREIATRIVPPAKSK